MFQPAAHLSSSFNTCETMRQSTPLKSSIKSSGTNHEQNINFTTPTKPLPMNILAENMKPNKKERPQKFRPALNAYSSFKVSGMDTKSETMSKSMPTTFSFKTSTPKRLQKQNSQFVTPTKPFPIVLLKHAILPKSKSAVKTKLSTANRTSMNLSF